MFPVDEGLGEDVRAGITGERVRTVGRMAGNRRASEPVIKVSRVMPLLPANEDSRARLQVFLTTMGCPRFLDLPWCWMDPGPAMEILTKDNRWFNTI